MASWLLRNPAIARRAASRCRSLSCPLPSPQNGPRSARSDSPCSRHTRFRTGRRYVPRTGGRGVPPRRARGPLRRYRCPGQRSQLGARRRKRELSVLDAFGADQGVSQLFHRAGLAFNYQHLEAIVVVEMNVQRGEDVVEVRVLQSGELFAEQPDVVIVDQRDRADYVAVGALPGFLYQLVADQVAKRLRAIGVSARGDEAIEFVEKIGIDGYADAAEFAHLYMSVASDLGRRLEPARQCVIATLSCEGRRSR